MALPLKWRAVYNDDSTLDQFEGQTEHMFSEINQAQLKRFELRDTTKAFTVSMANGLFNMNGTTKTPSAAVGQSGYQLYFIRRNQVRNLSGVILDPPRIRYIFGYDVAGQRFTATVQPQVGDVPEEVIMPPD